MNMAQYEAHIRSAPKVKVGCKDGEICSRIAEPDEDAPRRYRPKPCQGVMFIAGDKTDDCWIACDTCGETAV